MRDAQLVGHSDKLCQRPGAHLSHDLATMNPDRDLARPKVGGGLFVRETRNHERKNFSLARSEQVVVPLQLSEFQSLLPACSILSDSSLNGPQHLLLAEWFREELDRPRLHRAHGRRDIAVTGNENSWRRA